jgi:hypothetical protein
VGPHQADAVVAARPQRAGIGVTGLVHRAATRPEPAGPAYRITGCGRSRPQILGLDLNRSERISTRPFDGPCGPTRAGGGSEKSKVPDRAARSPGLCATFSPGQFFVEHFSGMLPHSGTRGQAIGVKRERVPVCGGFRPEKAISARVSGWISAHPNTLVISIVCTFLGGSPPDFSPGAAVF